MNCDDDGHDLEMAVRQVLETRTKSNAPQSSDLVPEWGGGEGGLGERSRPLV